MANEEIKETVLDVFHHSRDKWFSTLTGPQQASMILNCWFKRDTIDNDASIVLRKDGQFIGFVVARIEGGESEIGPIGLLPEYRGRGLGRAMLSHVVRQLRTKEAESAFICASTANRRAADLYSSLGFKKLYRTLMYAWQPWLQDASVRRPDSQSRTARFRFQQTNKIVFQSVLVCCD